MFENIITFTEELLESTLELTTSILASAAPNARELIDALIAAFRGLIRNIINILESIRPAADPALRVEIDAVIGTLRATLGVVTRFLRSLIPALRLNRQQALIILEEFVQNTIDDIAALLDALFNPPSPGF